MSLPEALEKHLRSEEAIRGEPKLRHTEDYVYKLPSLELGNETTLFNINDDILDDVLWGIDLTRGQRAGVRRLINEIALVHDRTGLYSITVGDIRRMTDKQLMLLGGGPSGFHPGPKSVRVLRALFGREEIDNNI